jgi:hypothetical protein
MRNRINICTEKANVVALFWYKFISIARPSLVLLLLENYVSIYSSKEACHYCARFEVLIAMLLKILVLWVVTLW